MRLENLANRRCVGVAPVHQLRDVGEADVAVLELFMIQHANAAPANDLVAVEGEVHLLDAVTLRARAEFSLGALGATGEKDAVARVHGAILTQLHERE